MQESAVLYTHFHFMRRERDSLFCNHCKIDEVTRVRRYFLGTIFLEDIVRRIGKKNWKEDWKQWRKRERDREYIFVFACQASVTFWSLFPFRPCHFFLPCLVILFHSWFCVTTSLSFHSWITLRISGRRLPLSPSSPLPFSHFFPSSFSLQKSFSLYDHLFSLLFLCCQTWSFPSLPLPLSFSPYLSVMFEQEKFRECESLPRTPIGCLLHGNKEKCSRWKLCLKLVPSFSFSSLSDPDSWAIFLNHFLGIILSERKWTMIGRMSNWESERREWKEKDRRNLNEARLSESELDKINADWLTPSSSAVWVSDKGEFILFY